MKRFGWLDDFLPFVMVGVSLVLVAGLLLLFTYLFMWGVALGGVLYAIYTIRQLWLHGRTRSVPVDRRRSARVSRTYDQDVL